MCESDRNTKWKTRTKPEPQLVEDGIDGCQPNLFLSNSSRMDQCHPVVYIYKEYLHEGAGHQDEYELIND